MITILERLNRSLRSGFLEIFGDDELNRFTRGKTGESLGGENTLIRIAAFLQDRLSRSEAEGAAITIGKFAYPHIKNEFPDKLKFREAQFRILPIDDRIRTGLMRLVETVLNPGGVPIILEETDGVFRFLLENTQFSEKTGTIPIACISGMILECCADISGGKTYRCELENRRELCLFKKPIGH